jgi:phage terminase large subunit
MLITSSRQVPAKLAPLLGPARHKAAYGGRGGSKSWFFGDEAVERTLTGQRGVCVREVQNSLSESCHQLIVDCIARRGVGEHFNITKDQISCPTTGGRIIFRGMNQYNATNIKSLEGFDWAWVEEAQDFSQESIDMLVPTIRKPGSELWWSWNPRHETDPVDRMFRQTPPEGAIVIQIGWQDNPWLPQVLRDEKDALYKSDPEKAEWVWGGEYQTISEGAIFGAQMMDAKRDDRLTEVPYDPRLPVWTGWDLGRDDETAIWFAQQSGDVIRIIDYYQNSMETLPHYADVLKSKGYSYAGHFLPHDGNNKTILSDHSAKEQLEQLGLGNITVIPRAANMEAVLGDLETARAMIAVCRFDEAKAKDGIRCLQQYRREYDARLQTFKQRPLHDRNSHGADAFRTLAVAWNGDKMLVRKATPLKVPNYAA